MDAPVRPRDEIGEELSLRLYRLQTLIRESEQLLPAAANLEDRALPSVHRIAATVQRSLGA